MGTPVHAACKHFYLPPLGAEPRSPCQQGGPGRRSLCVTMDAVWASPAAGRGPREPGGWLSTVGATTHGEGALSETPQGELTQEKFRTEPVPRVGVSRAGPQGALPGVPEQWVSLPGSCPSFPGTASCCCPSGTSGARGGWPWPGTSHPVGTTEPHSGLT